MLYTQLWNCKADMTESILEALHYAVVNECMGKEERHINLSLTWPGLQHPNANGSYGQRCGHSHKLTQVLFQLSHITDLCYRLFFFFPPVSALMFHISSSNQMKIDYQGSCLDRQSTLALCWCSQTKLSALFFCLSCSLAVLNLPSEEKVITSSLWDFSALGTFLIWEAGGGHAGSLGKKEVGGSLINFPLSDPALWPK